MMFQIFGHGRRQTSKYIFRKKIFEKIEVTQLVIYYNFVLLSDLDEDLIKLKDLGTTRLQICYCLVVQLSSASALILGEAWVLSINQTVLLGLYTVLEGTAIAKLRPSYDKLTNINTNFPVIGNSDANNNYLQTPSAGLSTQC